MTISDRTDRENATFFAIASDITQLRAYREDAIFLLARRNYEGLSAISDGEGMDMVRKARHEFMAQPGAELKGTENV